jgi:2-hydroxychromene-2-carboxylate isomerase
MNIPRTIDWYFDFVSPFAYLQTYRLAEIPGAASVIFRPVLFAGLLDYWQTKGPAEVEPKRIHTFRYIQWLAQRMGVPYRLPPTHPFNPLKALRLAVALNSEPKFVFGLFRGIWVDGLLPDDAHGWIALCRSIGLEPEQAEEQIAATEVKTGLRANGQRAIAAGVFGVPTFVADGHVFWGLDATDFFIDYLNDPTVLDNPEMTRVTTLPASASRLVD